MMKTLALIHTSLVFLTIENVINQLLAELLPDVRRINIVDDSLLADVIAKGEISPQVQERMLSYIRSAELAGADAILSVCSSVGPVIDIARQQVSVPLIKIDDPMTERAVRDGARIGVLATVKTTLKPTLALLEEKASALEKDVELRPRLVEGAFQALVSGNKEAHDEMISREALELMDEDVDLLVLAQASMTRLAPRLHNETRRTVLSRPRLAIEHTRVVLDSLPIRAS
jgi:Asp/Glu/hydantoin racemase